MAPSEFDLIRRYFVTATGARDDVDVGIGDDCALLRPPPGELLAVSTDTLVAGRHFRADTDPTSLGHKALAVNLSDLAAVGARPAWATLALTLPAADTHWLESFMTGFAALAGRHAVQLIGGDTTRGPLSITLTVHGFVAAERALRRDGASAGERVMLSGTVGDAALALRREARGELLDTALKARLDRPEPRIALAQCLGGRASAAIDVSDGLVADLGHLCAASGVGARLHLAQLPLSAAVAACTADGDWSAPLAGGDDYELVFCVAADRVAALRDACAASGTQLTEIGELVDTPGIMLIYPDGSESEEVPGGFDHFRE